MKLLIALSLSAALIFLARYLSDVLLPFFVACFISYMLQPLVELNRRLIHEKGRIISSFLALLEVLSIIVGMITLFLPNVLSELDMLGRIIHKVTSGQLSLPPDLAAIIKYVEDNFNPNSVKEILSEFHFDSLLSKGRSLVGESLNVLGTILEWAMTLIYILFILIDYPAISRGFKLIVPFKYREGAMSIVHDVQESMNHYFRGQGIVALIAMVFYCIGFSIIGLPLAIPMGILVGILYMIPYFQYITLIPVSLICLIYSIDSPESFGMMFGKSLLVYAISQSICDYIITPHIMGKEMGLNPAVILLALSIWGSLLGIIGMIIALPLTSLIMAYYERYISNPKAIK